MSRVAMALALVLAISSAGAAALIVLPAPSKAMALLAIVTSEKVPLILGGAALGIGLALFSMRSGRWLLPASTILLCLAAAGVSLVPLLAAARLAREQRVALDPRRYLWARIDTQGPVVAAKTVTYATIEGRALGLDVYAPSVVPTRSTRAIVVVHGGSWSGGDRGDASLASRWFADQGFTVFDVEYRTAPQPSWQTAVGDVKCAVGWIKRHASTADWNIDPLALTLLGRSAGGHLALLAAYAPLDERLPPSCPLDGGDGDSSVESVVAFYAPTDLVWGYAHPASRRVYDSSAVLRQFCGGPPEAVGERYAIVSPTERATPAAPRTLLIHGGHDQFVGQQHLERLSEKLHALGVPCTTLIIPYAQHGFDFVFGGLSGQIAEAVVLRFLHEGGATPERPAHRPPPPRR
jgi:acetyl esterase/lipase